MKNDEQMKVYPFGKGIGFALLNDIDSISKIEEQLGKSKIIGCEPTNLLSISKNLKKKANFIKRCTR